MARFILTPFGSAGDVNPFLWMGRNLRARGHEVTLITSWHFEAAAGRAGLRFVGLGEPGEYDRIVQDADLWHPRRGYRVVFAHAGRSIAPYFEAIRDSAGGQPAVLVAPGTVLGARLAREALGLPLATVHLQPSCMPSAYDTPVLFAGLEWVCRLPRWLKQVLLKLPNPADRLVLPGLRRLCAPIGVTPPRHLMPDWWHSPDLVLMLFPDWFAAAQPDWPQPYRQLGFPLYDEGDRFPLPPDLEAFLAAGTPPVLFTPGSSMAHGHEFFATAVAACGALNRRALFVTRHPEQLPPSLPATILHCAFVPFSRVLPRCAAMVHHGGIGTLSQALAAGVPQLIMPMAHDQPDNAHRVRRLGAGRFLYPRKFTPDNLARELGALLEDPAVAAACATTAARLRQTDSSADLVAALETLAM